MVSHHTLTAEFTEAVDDLVQNAAIPDSTLHSRAQQYLEIFNEAKPVQVKRQPAWAERIDKACPQQPNFTTPGFFDVIYQVADELGLIAGRRYVSAAICVCGGSVARAGAAPEEQAVDMAQALHQLSSTWVAFLLWPFYAYANEYREREEDSPPASGDETPTAESIAREHRRRWKEQVMARDDYRCFMCGGLDSRAYDAGRAIPEGSRLAFCYTVPIISPEVWTQRTLRDRERQSDQRLSSQDITLGILARFSGIDTATLIEKAQDGPLNALFVNSSSENTFRKLLWCLHPSETPDRYEIRSYGSPVYVGCDHITPHVTFVDHSASSGAGVVDLPDRELLRAHAALAGVLHQSAVRDVFRFLRYYLPSAYRGAAGRAIYPAPTGAVFWKSLVEYAGPEVSLEVQVWCDSELDPEPESWFERGGKLRRQLMAGQRRGRSPGPRAL